MCAKTPILFSIRHNLYSLNIQKYLYNNSQFCQQHLYYLYHSLKNNIM